MMRISLNSLQLYWKIVVSIEPQHHKACLAKVLFLMILRLGQRTSFQGFDVDFSNLRNTFGCGSVDLDGCGPHDTNRDLLVRLSNMAISHYKHDTGISLELVKVLRANYHPSAAVTFYMTFEANDPSHGNQTKRFQAVVRYLPVDSEVCSCQPEPSS